MDNQKVDKKTGEINEYPLDEPTVQVAEKVFKTPAVAAPAPLPVKKDDHAEVAILPGSNPFTKLLMGKQKALQNFLGNNQNALRFMSSVMHCVEKVPTLRTCGMDSVMGAFMECAALGLYPGNASGDCYVLPYAGKAQFQIGYRGLKTLAFRAGIIACGSDVVYSNDKYKETRGTHPKIDHVAAEGDRGKPVRAYAWAETSPGHIVFKAMSEDEIMKIKALSQAKDSKYSPWNSGNDPQLWMWQKTCFKQLAKLLPTSEKLDRAIYADSVSERGGYFAKENEIVEVDWAGDQEVKIEIGKDKKQALRDKNAKK